jgi:transcriptional antiterminator RfaH
MSQHWLALYTHPRAEKRVSERLRKKNIEAYLPLQKRLSQWKDRKKWIEEPLIRSYVFVNVDEKDYYEALNTNGIVRYVTFSGKAAVIPEWQIIAMKNILGSDQDFEIVAGEFQKGDKVKVISGVLNGAFGEWVSLKNEKKVLIRIDHINHCLLVNIPLEHLKPVC